MWVRKYGLGAALIFALGIVSIAAQNDSQSGVQWPVHNNGNNTVVEWDHYSFIVNGKRLYIFGGEVSNELALKVRDR